MSYGKKKSNNQEGHLVTEATSSAQVSRCNHCWSEGPRWVQNSCILYPSGADFRPAGIHKAVQRIKNPESKILKELKAWINYFYYLTLQQNKKLYQLPCIFFQGLWKEKQRRAADLYQITNNTDLQKNELLLQAANTKKALKKKPT